MKTRILVRRYAQGLVNSVRDRDQFRDLTALLRRFLAVLSERRNLGQTLSSPFLPASKRVAVGADVLARLFGLEVIPHEPPILASSGEELGPAGSAAEKAARFVLLLVENERLPLFGPILELAPRLWNEEQGISTFDVLSVVPLSDDQKSRLSGKLEQLEGRPVALEYRIDPALIGGLSIKKGNIVYDVSIAGQLDRIKQQIAEG